MLIGRHSQQLLVGEWTLFIAPVGSDPATTFEPDGPWELLHPRVPDDASDLAPAEEEPREG